MRAEEARDLFSSACDGELSDAELAAFEGALAQDPVLHSEYDDFCAFVRDTAALAAWVPAGQSGPYLSQAA